MMKTAPTTEKTEATFSAVSKARSCDAVNAMVIAMRTATQTHSRILRRNEVSTRPGGREVAVFDFDPVPSRGRTLVLTLNEEAPETPSCGSHLG